LDVIIAIINNFFLLNQLSLLRDYRENSVVAIIAIIGIIIVIALMAIDINDKSKWGIDSFFAEQFCRHTCENESEEMDYFNIKI
jgi:hypothetical protein